MTKIDDMGSLTHVGDNRHSPLRIIDAKLHPYEVRTQESRDAERRTAPKKRRYSRKAAEDAVKNMMNRVKK